MTLQPTLFDESPPAQRPFLLTNRYNLLEILASRLLEPRSGFGKYYRDLLELCPGRLALVGEPFPADLVSLVSSEDPTAFPVAVEISRAALGPETPFLPAGTGGDDGCPPAWAPAGTIPLTRVVGIHFQSSDDADEHRLREYENVRHATDLYQVTPDLFAGSDGASDAVLAWFRSTRHPTDEERAGGTDPDRLGGAIVLMASVCPPLEPAIETLRRCLGNANARKGRRSYAQWLVAVLTAKPSRQPGLDEMLHAVSLHVFSSVDASQAWRGTEVLSAIREAVLPRLAGADGAQLEEHFDRLRQILRSERPFERLRPHGSPAEKALLLALMRPDPKRFASWDPEETGADWEVTLAAASLVGALRGRRRMTIELRSPELDDLLALREATARSAATESTAVLEPPPSIRVEFPTAARARPTRLLAGRTLLRAWEVPDETTSALARLADWETSRDAGLESALVELCDELGWDDCTLTVVVTSGQAPMAADPDGTRYVIPGRVGIERQLDADRFLARLRSDDTAPDDRTRAVRLVEAAGPQSEVNSQRYSNRRNASSSPN